MCFIDQMVSVCFLCGGGYQLDCKCDVFHCNLHPGTMTQNVWGILLQTTIVSKLQWVYTLCLLTLLILTCPWPHPLQILSCYQTQPPCQKDSCCSKGDPPLQMTAKWAAPQCQPTQQLPIDICAHVGRPRGSQGTGLCPASASECLHILWRT